MQVHDSSDRHVQIDAQPAFVRAAQFRQPNVLASATPVAARFSTTTTPTGPVAVGAGVFGQPMPSMGLDELPSSELDRTAETPNGTWAGLDVP